MGRRGRVETLRPARKMPIDDVCASCSGPVARGEGRHTGTASALFLGSPIVYCSACVQKQDDAESNAEKALLSAGYLYRHVPEEETDGWLGGRHRWSHPDGSAITGREGNWIVEAEHSDKRSATFRAHLLIFGS